MYLVYLIYTLARGAPTAEQRNRDKESARLSGTLPRLLVRKLSDVVLPPLRLRLLLLCFFSGFLSHRILVMLKC